MARAREDREEWRRRVDRWKDSGLTAKEFAAEIGINAGTLQFWQYKLRRSEAPAKRPRPTASSERILSALVEVRPAGPVVVDPRFEIELRNGRRIRVTAEFAPAALRALVAVLEGP
jgi:transposase